ncbi:elongation factor P maturation arginine rhamnosyltransferase EarP [Aquincola sp. MAHUQ-54]|uniref:Protein-arginine rhamnosyltransferase n=1 Tax=Aquincola agrisoli TaxID=3119538 RepID=A0AAW9Q4A0_9BURK
MPSPQPPPRPPAQPPAGGLRWDLFCRVIDNYGDVGVSWRLAAGLAARGHAVRLWLDDGAPLAWMAPHGAPGVQVLPWGDPPAGMDPGDVVVETFGCDPPPAFVDRMAAAAVAPVWINLEYLSAEGYVERSHGLPSPQRNGLTKWFFYPGFTVRTGGLLREPGLMAEREAFDRDAWLAGFGLRRRPGERVASLFAYPGAPFGALMERLDEAPTLMLVCAGASQAPALSAFEALARRPSAGRLRVHAMPWLPQAGFDRLLWSCDLNFVRGEDSIVRAMWAGAPFAWHIYPQHDDAHVAKLDALLGLWQQDAGPALAAGVRALWHAWNGIAPTAGALAAGTPWPDARAWRTACEAWRGRLLAQPDLVTQLLAFQSARRSISDDQADADPSCA